MATIHKEIPVNADPQAVWAAVRDVGAAHHRLFPGLVADVQMDEGARTVTFANGLVLRELIVTVDDANRRIVYASVGGNAAHHNASIQVFDETPGGARVSWITDFLPDALAPTIGGLVEQGSALMKRTLESGKA